MVSKDSIKSIIEAYKIAQREREEFAKLEDAGISKTYFEAIAETLGDVIEDLENLLEG